MDWSDLSLRLDTQGYVLFTDDLGNETRLDFTVPYHGIYLLLVGRDV